MINEKLAEALRDAEATVLAFLGDVAFDGSVCGIKQAIVKGMFARLQAHAAEAAHPQPAQDAKDAARYRHMIEASPFMCFGASEYRKKSDLDEAIDDSIAAMAKESGR